MKIKLFPICGVCKKRILYPLMFSVLVIEKKDGKVIGSHYRHRRCDK